MNEQGKASGISVGNMEFRNRHRPLHGRENGIYESHETETKDTVNEQSSEQKQNTGTAGLQLGNWTKLQLSLLHSYTAVPRKSGEDEKKTRWEQEREQEREMTLKWLQDRREEQEREWEREKAVEREREKEQEEAQRRWEREQAQERALGLAREQVWERKRDLEHFMSLVGHRPQQEQQQQQQ